MTFSWNDSANQVFDVDSWSDRKQKRRENKRQKTQPDFSQAIVISDDEGAKSSDSEVRCISPPPGSISRKRLETNAAYTGAATSNHFAGPSSKETPRKRKFIEPIASTTKNTPQMKAPTLSRPLGEGSSTLSSSSRLVKEEYFEEPSLLEEEEDCDVESDSSEDYGWDNHWDPFTQSNVVIPDLSTNMEGIHISRPKKRSLVEEEEFQREKEELKKAIRGSKGTRIQQFMRVSGIAPRWTVLQRQRQTISNQVQPAIFGPRIRSNLTHELNFGGLKLCKEFKRSAGPIVNILQLPGTKRKNRRDFIVTSAATNGTLLQDPDDGENTPSPYNKVGSLLHCMNDQVHVVNGHYRRIANNDKEDNLNHIRAPGKTYSVTAAALDPCRQDTFVTGGGDGLVILWKVLEGENIDIDDMDDHILLGYNHVANVDDEFVSDGHDHARRVNPSLRADARIRYNGIVQDVRYHPEEKKLLAVGCSDGFIYIYPDISVSRTSHPRLRVSPKNQSAASMVWGTGATKPFLFSSTEGEHEDDYHGYHYAFDVASGRSTPAYKFNDIDGVEQGDAMALDPRGDRLAICSITETGTHHLRLFDVRNRRHYATHTIELEPFGLPDEDHNVHKLLFDPLDGLYIALGRADNGIDVYDTRFIGKHKTGLLRRYQHEGSHRPQANVPPEVRHKDSGINDFHWVVNSTTNRMGLISGGDDGCVRLWDINTHDGHNSEVLVQMDDTIAAISLGDRSQNQYPVIVGDYSGGVSVFDRVI